MTWKLKFVFSNELRKLTKHHYDKSDEHKKILMFSNYNLNNFKLNKSFANKSLKK